MPEGFNLFRWLIEAMNPCVHQWETITTLKDDDEAPAAVTVVRSCIVCGKLHQDTIAAPVARSKGCAEGVHKWTTQCRVAVYDGTGRVPDKMPSWFDHEQQCERCGDVRVKRL